MGSNQQRYDLIAVVFFFLVAMFLEYREAFSLIEDETLSYRQILRTHYGDDFFTNPSEDVVIVFTDEEFYTEYDKYPLRRTDLSTIILRLNDMGASVVAIDMLLDFNSAYGEDPTLEDALAETGNVLLVSQAEIEKGEYLGLNTAIDRFNDVTNHGYSNIAPNSAISESIVRLRIHREMVNLFDAWPFAVKAVSMSREEEPELVNGVLSIGPEIEVQLDQFDEMYIDYPLLPGVSGGIASLHEIIGISASDLLFVDDEEELEDLAYLVNGKIALIGEVAEVAHDQFGTPVGNVYGVEVIANSISTIIKNGPLKAASLGLELLVGFLLLAVFLCTRLIQAPLPRNSISIAVLVLYVLFTSYLYISIGLVFSISYLLIASVFSIIVINTRFYISEMGQKAMIREMFGQYLSPKVVENLVDDPRKIQLGGEEREMTAFFSDIQGFSSISERLTPTELVQLLNDYLTDMCDIILGAEGTVDKFEGDSIMAFWGAPTRQADHAKRACFAAIEMNDRLIELRVRALQKGVTPLVVRMGVNTGTMVVGNMGSKQRMNYTVMGDAVNLASRLEGANKAYGSGMMISESTYRSCEADIDVRELDRITVVGKSEPVTVYQLLNRKNLTTGVDADLVDQFSKGLELYKAGDFRRAKSEFSACLDIFADDGPALAYISRCQAYTDNPPDADWDGVYRLTEKG
ncbi:MAG: adenylate/guanylate cyclase domain-containing protein [Gammaproteobacteria bacterium]|jgi:adenylate cyclase|nr:adenylate/guanylate cyclase domain-containing protein [Gammaproteobacteria bacterium]MBT5441320.1 adenylate/guanylate cyclase domain-containing protein [Gammaproteobacteria bacterium]MBT5793183.1 adenylate/guanylate cyclase domain-containing protein [Gammaproteobacteria bacterium]MBT6571624.1 adenylate/guanylate cyclase domain-containing protein [Gammaproteobacteria bacterium]MBT6666689.1 adenylate/guanylate cyclase domain-containing protein [Gammaproteobacteria bacterium]